MLARLRFSRYTSSARWKIRYATQRPATTNSSERVAKAPANTDSAEITPNHLRVIVAKPTRERKVAR
jgi:hypothetical protein